MITLDDYRRHAAIRRGDEIIAAVPELYALALEARDYLSGIPESAAGGDDAAVDLTRRLDALLRRMGGAP